MSNERNKDVFNVNAADFMRRFGRQDLDPRYDDRREAGGVTKQTAWEAVRGDTWRHVEGEP